MDTPHAVFPLLSVHNPALQLGQQLQHPQLAADEPVRAVEPGTAQKSRIHPTAIAVGIAVTMPHCRRREKYLPRQRSGTMSAIQLIHAGPPTAPAACMTKIKAMKISTAVAAALRPKWVTIQSGISATGNHNSR